MKLRLHLLTVVGLCGALLVSGCSTTSSPAEQGWPAPYPFAGAAVAEPDVSATLDVVAPENIVTGIPAPLSVTITTTADTVVVPRLLVSTVSPATGTVVPFDNVTVESAGGTAISSGVMSANPDIGLKWSAASDPLVYALPPVQVSGTVTIPLKVTVWNPSVFTSGALFAADTGEATAASPSVWSQVITSGLPTPVSTTMWATAMNRLPENLRDPLPPTGVLPPVPGQSVEQWVPTPHAHAVTRSSPKPLRDSFAGLSLAQIAALQTQPTVKQSPVLNPEQCTLTPGPCTVTMTVTRSSVDQADTGTAQFIVMSSHAVSGNPAVQGWTATTTVDGQPVDNTASVVQDTAVVNVPVNFGDNLGVSVTVVLSKPNYPVADTTIRFGWKTAERFIDTAAAVDASNGTVGSLMTVPGQIDQSQISNPEVFSPAETAELQRLMSK